MDAVIEWLRSIHWLHRLHLWYWLHLRCPVWLFCHLPIFRMRYRRQLKRIRRVYGRRPIRVVFPVGNLAKWKMQSILDAMIRSEHYEPVVAFTMMDVERYLPEDRRRVLMADFHRHFEPMGVRCVDAYDVDTDSYTPLSAYAPDVVWYSQPWNIHENQGPNAASKSALTCYVPYFVQNYGGLDMDCQQLFHRELWRHFTLNQQWADVFMREQDATGGRAGEVVGAGHPMLDQFSSSDDCGGVREYVIYAPHWSCDTGECFSTFLKNGERILDLARRHPEVKWVFKPHPILRYMLIENFGWSKERVDGYYASWEALGQACYSGDYVELFRRSRAMITDCASFLVEYACTGMPLIRLVSPNAKYSPHPISAKLFATYYQARDWDEFMSHFNEVVVGGKDPKRGERLAAVRETRLCDTNAAKNILDYLTGVFSCSASV